MRLYYIVMQEYGTNCFDLLKGKFVFAIYNIKSKKLVIVRDRVGEKPLYFYNNQGVMLFVLELKSIIKAGFVKKFICKKALTQYLQLTYIPAPNI